VIGKIYRARGDNVPNPPPPKKRKAAVKLEEWLWPEEPDPWAPPPPLTVDEDFLHTDLVSLEAHHCRWHDGDGPFTFCGQTTSYPGHVYCPNHERMSQQWPSTEV
jgi:hypothetical protein